MARCRWRRARPVPYAPARPVAPLQCPWGEKALSNYLGADREPWSHYDACALIEGGARVADLLVDQGEADSFLEDQLKTHLLVEACEKAGQKAEIRMQPGYDHSYYFISTFMEDHLRWHAERLGWSLGGRSARALVVAVDFLRRRDVAMDAESLTLRQHLSLVRLPGPGGKIMHAAIRIGDSVMMLMDDFPEWGSLVPKALKGTPVTLHLYVQDVDAAMQQAVAAGAQVTLPAADMFWGDRYGQVVDPFGHRWSIATHKEDLTPEEIQANMAKMGPMEGCGDPANKPG